MEERCSFGPVEQVVCSVDCKSAVLNDIGGSIPLWPTLEFMIQTAIVDNLSNTQIGDYL